MAQKGESIEKIIKKNIIPSNISINVKLASQGFILIRKLYTSFCF